VPKTLLAVDDSATMRKVLEITFAGEDFRVVTAESSQKALALMSENPVAVVIDMSLNGEDSYALAKQVRSRSSAAVIVMMASRYNPYDANKGREAGADDFIDKPFDTQAFLDKVKKALVAREASKGAPVAAAAPPAPAPPAPVPQTSPAFQVPRTPVVSAMAPSLVGPTQRPAVQVQRTHTLSFDPSAPPPPPPAAPAQGPGARPPAAAPVVPPALARTSPSVQAFHQPPAPPAPPLPAPVAPPPRTPGAVSALAGQASPPAGQASAPAVAPNINGQLASKLGDLGLSPAQVEAVLALSREVVERVVWEVVPQLAETIIKEEIARLTKEG
jgi:DNA-binding response OmpR family regulator